MSKINNQTKTNITASYIYTIENGVIYFALCRKIQDGARQRINRTGKTGAAGTDEKYWGKWGNFGGGANSKISAIKASIQEINDEGDLKSLGYNFDDNGNRTDGNNLICNFSIKIDYVSKTIPRKTIPMAIFLYELKYPKFFFKLYPKLVSEIGGQRILRNDGGRRGPGLVTSSHGEIDAVGSLSYEEMLDFQRCDNTVFLSYFCKTFNTTIKPELEKIEPEFKTEWGRINLIINPDNSSRKPIELPVKDGEYKEVTDGKYRKN